LIAVCSHVAKGSLILEKFSLSGSNLQKKGAKSTLLSIFSLVNSPRESDFAPIFGDFSQNKKLSEIKPPSVQSRLLEVK
jgi:hypothetical protein